MIHFHLKFKLLVAVTFLTLTTESVSKLVKLYQKRSLFMPAASSTSAKQEMPN